MRSALAPLVPIILVALGPAGVAAQQPTVAADAPSLQWGALRPGPHQVGFRAIFRVDSARGYHPKVDHNGIRDTLQTARPMQIGVWYPAVVHRGSEPMRFGQYVELEGEALGPERADASTRVEARESLRRGPLNRFFPDGVGDDDLANVLSTPTAAFRDAAAAPGAFPLILHAGFGLIGQSVLLEYLASHGYVVATLPLLGTGPAWYNRGEGTPASYQVGADDVGFLYATVGGLEFVDQSRAAAIGMFSANGLLYQMQHMQLDAIAVLDGGYPAALRQVPGFDPRAVRIPILDMPRAGDRPDRSMLDSLRFADRWEVEFREVDHGDFYQFQRIAIPERAEEHVAYHLIARYTRAFLDATLKGDPDAARFLALDPDRAGAPAGMMTITFRPGEPALPTENEFLRMIRDGAHENARAAWARTAEPLAEEGTLTTTLLFLRRDAGPRGAIEGFRLLADMYPASWRAREHVATTLRLAGDNEGARRTYEEALRLLSSAAPPPADIEAHRSRLEEAIAQ